MRELFDYKLYFIPLGIKRYTVLFAHVITNYYQYTHILLYSHVSGKNIEWLHMTIIVFSYILRIQFGNWPEVTLIRTTYIKKALWKLNEINNNKYTMKLTEHRPEYKFSKYYYGKTGFLFIFPQIPHLYLHTYTCNCSKKDDCFLRDNRFKQLLKTTYFRE